MRQLRSPFFAYRYLVTPIDIQQRSILHELNKNKEDLMLDIFESINQNAKTVWVKGLKRYLFYGFQKKENLFIIKFAKESNENIFVEGENDIEIQDIKEAKFVFLIVDTKHQMILLERNQSIFTSINNSVDVIAEFLREKMREYDYVVNIYPLVSKRKFWNYVDNADEIFELSLEMNAPNMPLFGNSDTREILQKIKDTTNNEIFDIAFKNKEGKLKIVKEALEGWIDYVREVGGRYILKFKKDGVTETKTSESDTAKTYLGRKKTDRYSDEELANISDKIKLIHNLESRDEE
jgi:Holliday junction resolvase